MTAADSTLVERGTKTWSWRALAPSPRALKGSLGIIMILAIWWVSVPLVGLPEFFYPPPQAVWNSFVDMMVKGVLPSHIVDSLFRYTAGLFIATNLGLLIGLSIALNRTIARAMEPLVNFLYALIEIAWLPILILWFGFGLTTILVTVVYVVIWPIIFNAIVGVRSLPAVYVNAALSLGGSRWQVICDVILPGVLPQVLTGFRIAAGFAFRALILGEILAGTSGLGYLIFETANNLQTDRTLVGMICMGLMWLFIDNLYLKPFEGITVRRWGVLLSAEDNE